MCCLLACLGLILQSGIRNTTLLSQIPHSSLSPSTKPGPHPHWIHSTTQCQLGEEQGASRPCTYKVAVCLFIYLRKNVTICYVARGGSFLVILVRVHVIAVMIIILLLLLLMVWAGEDFYNLITMMGINFICFQLTNDWE